MPLLVPQHRSAAPAMATSSRTSRFSHTAFFLVGALCSSCRAVSGGRMLVWVWVGERAPKCSRPGAVCISPHSPPHTASASPARRRPRSPGAAAGPSAAPAGGGAAPQRPLAECGPAPAGGGRGGRPRRGNNSRMSPAPAGLPASSWRTCAAAPVRERLSAIHHNTCVM